MIFGSEALKSSSEIFEAVGYLKITKLLNKRLVIMETCFSFWKLYALDNGLLAVCGI